MTAEFQNVNFDMADPVVSDQALMSNNEHATSTVASVTSTEGLLESDSPFNIRTNMVSPSLLQESTPTSEVVSGREANLGLDTGKVLRTTVDWATDRESAIGGKPAEGMLDNMKPDSDTNPESDARESTSPFGQNDGIGHTNSFPPFDSDQAPLPNAQAGEQSFARNESGDSPLKHGKFTFSGTEMNEHESDDFFDQSGAQDEVEGSPSYVPQSTNPVSVTQQEGQSLVGGESQSSPVKGRRFSWSDIGFNQDNYDNYFEQLNAQTKPIYNPPEAEIRYDEGVPLVDHEVVSPTESSKVTASIDDIFKNDEVPEEDENFFSSNARSADPAPAFPSISRKDTTEVLGSLNFDQNDSLDSPVEPPAFPTEHKNITDVESSNLQPADTEKDLEERWKAVLDDDLLDDDNLLSENGPEQNESTDTRFTDEAKPVFNFTAPSPRINPYVPHQPSSTDLVNVPTLEPEPAPQVQNVAPPEQTQRAESFADRAKEGYRSPYDIPLDFSRPPRRGPMRMVSHPTLKGPPRISSMTNLRASALTNSFTPPPPPSIPPLPSIASRTGRKPEETKSSQADNFYEELPNVTQSRPSTRGRYTPAPTLTVPPPAPAIRHASVPPPLSRKASSHFGPPRLERLDPSSGSNLSVPAAPSVPSQAARYSPKPPSFLGSKPPGSPKYSPMPPMSTSSGASKYAMQNGLPPPPALPFQPRTSSPLVHNEGPPPSPKGFLLPEDTSAAPVPSPLCLPDEYFPNVSRKTHENGAIKPEGDIPVTPPTRNGYEPFSQHILPQQRTSPPSVPSQLVSPPSAPSHMVSPPPIVSTNQFDGFRSARLQSPKRPQTQSPNRRRYEPAFASNYHDIIPRPASVSARSPPPLMPFAATASVGQPPPEFIPPSLMDGEVEDPLERWKGAPVFKFGFGGTVVSIFPKHTPRFSAGHLVPRIKSSVGEIKVYRQEKLLIEPNLTKFPGPLKSKSKKKDVLAWLSSVIANFENGVAPESERFSLEFPNHYDENVLLWRIVKVMVEHDGVLTGNPSVEKAVRELLVPGIQEPTGLQETSPLGVAFGSQQTLSGSTLSEPISSEGLERIRQHLTLGNREEAVWQAVDNRLWGHAMLLSSTLDRSIWKQVVQEFVRRDVRSLDGNTEPLSTLYEIFAGNLEDSMDELVPPSARAGLQMVSKVSRSGPKNALDGLNKWRETLSMILSNRSPDDCVAILSLSRLLASYGRIAASHVCALFVRSPTIPIPMGGVDDPNALFVLLGQDHKQFPYTFASHRDSILLTETYEFASSILVQPPISGAIPHLQAFKLYHAIILAQEGNLSEALQYCDVIGSIVKSATKPSRYYHQTLLSSLDELSRRLRQAHFDSSSSWLPRPSIGKVSDSMWAKFNSFVVGEEGSESAQGSPHLDNDTGPFANIVGTPPTGQSPAEHGSYFHQHHQSVPAPPSNSRYAPTNPFATGASPDYSRSRVSLDSPVSSFNSPRLYNQPYMAQDHQPKDGNPGSYYGPYSSSPVHHKLPSPSLVQNSPLGPVQEKTIPEPVSTMPSLGNPYATAGVQGTQPISMLSASLSPPKNSPHDGYQPPEPSTGYEPPSSTNEMPPSPDNAASDDEKPRPKKKSIMDDDDDDDIAARAASLKASEKVRQDREAAEAFKKAAEEDGEFVS